MELSGFSGCGTALVTPFRKDSSVDEPALRALVDWQIESGINFLVACGTTGETSTLADGECYRAIEITIDAARGRVPIIAGCTHNATAEVVSRARKLSEVKGLTAILTANPFYNRPGQEGQYQHFRAVADATDLPVILYNIPGRTAANLEPATVLRLAEIKNIVGIKESSGNIVQITELIHAASANFRVLAGDDAIALPVIALGGAGLVSVASNAIPAQMSQLVSAALGNDWQTARDLNRRFFPLMQAHFCEPSPAPIKAVLNLMGRMEETVRLPIVPVTPATKAKLQSILKDLDLIL